MKSLSSLLLVGVVLAFQATPLSAQLRGLGFIQGKVVTAAGAPVPDVIVVAKLTNGQGTIVGSSNQKGEWKVVGIARGDWQVSFEKDGYTKSHAKVVLETELTRIQPVTITMKPVN